MVVPVKHAGSMWGDPRKRHMKANFAQKERAYKEMGRPRGGLGGPKRRGNKWDALKVLGGTLMDLDGTMGYGHMNQAAQGIQQRNAMMAEQSERERRQAMLTKYTDGLTPEQAQLAQLAPEKFLNAQVERAFAAPAGPEYFKSGEDIIGVQNGQSSMVYDAPDAPTEVWNPIQDPTGQGGYWERSSTTGQTRRVGAPGTSVDVTVGADGNPYKSLYDVPMGGFVPANLIEGIKIPADHYAIRTDTGPGFAFEPIQGSSTYNKNETREEGLTIGTLIGDYADLDKNKAIRSRDNGLSDNLRGFLASSPLGRGWDSTFGSVENHEARDSIDGLSMNALMQMISMSDVSAKAMDSDAEMKAWLGAIKGDTFESALTKLHVLDTSFGSGNELEKAWRNGVIDEKTYRYVTNRVYEDPFTAEMAARAQRYASLSGAIGTERMTPNELESANDLLDYMSPEERALFEGGK